MYRKKASYYFAVLAVVLLLLVPTRAVVASWQRIAKLPTTVGCCFFTNDLTGWAGSGSTGQDLPLQIWFTTNGGYFWSAANVPVGSGQVTQISIRADGVGYASIYSQKTPTINLWKTIDGGYSWADVSTGSHLGTGAGITPTLQGFASWAIPVNSGGNTNGVFFMDDNTMLITLGPNSGQEAWGAYGDPQTRIWYRVSELSRTIEYSKNGGSNWLGRFNLGPFLTSGIPTGYIHGKGGVLYVQTERDGMFRSGVGDSGRTWFPVGGPSNYVDTRSFYVGGCRGEMALAFDEVGGVWKTIDGGDGNLGQIAPLSFRHPKFQQIPSCQNEIRIIKFTNYHCYDYVVNAITFVNNTAGAFSLQLPTVPDTLKNGETDSFKVFFDPSKKPGGFNARIKLSGVFLSGTGPIKVDSLIDITASASAEQPDMIIKPLKLTFDSVSVCGGFADSFFTIKNTGCDTITITSGPGGISSDFTIDPLSLPFRILPDSEIVIRCHYKPSTNGFVQTFPSYTATQQGLSASQMIEFDGFGEDGRAELTIKPLLINLDTLSICANGDSALVTLYNIGCGPLLVDAVTISGDPEYSVVSIGARRSVNPSDSITTWVHFVPSTKGKRTAVVNITTHSNSADSTVMQKTIPVQTEVISGKGIFSSPLSIVDLDTLSFCETRDTTLTFTNTGCDTLVITSGSIIGSGFTLTGNFPIIIPPKKIVSIVIHAVPNASSGLKNFSATVTLLIDGVTTVKAVTLSYSTKVAPTLTLWLTIDQPRAAVGNIVTVRLKADPAQLPICSSLDVSVGLNDDLLGFVGFRGVNTITKNSLGKYKIENTSRIQAASDSSIALFDYAVFVTKDTVTDIVLTPILINNAVPGTDPCAPQAIATGASFQYTDQCGDDLLHHIMGGDLTSIRVFSIAPNPTSGNTQIVIGSTEESDIELKMYSSAGVEVHREQHHLQIGNTTVTLHSNELPNGVYTLVTRSNNSRVISRIVMIK